MPLAGGLRRLVARGLGAQLGCLGRGRQILSIFGLSLIGSEFSGGFVAVIVVTHPDRPTAVRFGLDLNGHTFDQEIVGEPAGKPFIGEVTNQAHERVEYRESRVAVATKFNGLEPGCRAEISAGGRTAGKFGQCGDHESQHIRATQ